MASALTTQALQRSAKIKAMNIQVISALLLAAALGSCPAVRAQTQAANPAATQAPVPKEFTEGEVRNIDKAAGKVTLKHGEIKNLGMPPMAMVFGVKDAKLLDKFKPGDKVRFKAVHDAGRYVVVDLQPAK
jgi:Cu(I)/Ag(I) efflux system periplasmic protein CusF